MIIAQLKWKPLDKLLMLWTICVIDDRRQRNLSVSYAAITEEFGEDVNSMFRTYCEAAIEQKLLDGDSMQLTRRGNNAVAEWQRISQKIFAV
jgi:hypothetical protein